MIVIGVVAAALIVLALATQLGVIAVERSYPATGQTVAVESGRIHFRDLGPRNGADLPIVMLHGASSNLGTMQLPLGAELATQRRVILIDRPGHGWSHRHHLADSTPAIQGRMIDEALGKLGIARAIVVAHSWAGALGLSMALNHPERVAGLVLLAPVAYPWRGGVGRYNRLVAMPVIGPLLAYTITLPLGWLLITPGTRGVFQPQAMPSGYVKDAAIPLLLRPREFMANARDLVTLKAAVIQQAPRYPQIKVPMVIFHGDADRTVYPDIHSRPLAASVPRAGLIVLPGVGHMVQNAVPDLIRREIEAMEANFQAMPQVAAD